MHAGSEAFGRAATAIEAIAARDAEAYRMSVAAIVGDFTSRAVHLTGVPIADTALMLEQLAASRGFSRASRARCCRDGRSETPKMGRSTDAHANPFTPKAPPDPYRIAPRGSIV